MHNETAANSWMLCADALERGGNLTATRTRRNVNLKSMFQINRRTPWLPCVPAPLLDKACPWARQGPTQDAALLMFSWFFRTPTRTGGPGRRRAAKTNRLASAGNATLDAGRGRSRHGRAGLLSPHLHTPHAYVCSGRSWKEHSQVPLSNSCRAASIKINPRYPARGCR